MGIDLMQFSDVTQLPVKCITCAKIQSWPQMDAGHYFSRGHGGGSGTYFDERDIHAQCRTCNRFSEGNKHAYLDAMISMYGSEIVDELEVLHSAGRSYRAGQITAIGLMYKQLYQGLKQDFLAGRL